MQSLHKKLSLWDPVRNRYDMKPPCDCSKDENLTSMHRNKQDNNSRVCKGPELPCRAKREGDTKPRACGVISVPTLRKKALIKVNKEYIN